MKFRWEQKYLNWGITAFLVIVTSILFFKLLDNFSGIYSVLQKIAGILMPFVVGFVIAYLLIPIMRFFEENVIKKIWDKTKYKRKESSKAPRAIAIIITVLLAMAMLTGLLFMVIPQLLLSIKGIIGNFSVYTHNLEEWAMGLVSSNEVLKGFLAEELETIGNFVSNWAQNNLLPQVNDIISGLTSGVFGAVNFLKNVFVGLVISIYVMMSKEKFLAQSKKFTFAIFPATGANRIISIVRRAHVVFGGFITGKLIDSLIIGIMCFVGMSIFNMPYAMLISVIIGITNIIPFFGPFIGAIPSGLLILMIDPLTCLYFILFILALQQFDGNILGPMILGDSTGLSAFWVIFAILLSGGLFGFPGMVMGVPAFAVIYSLIVEFINHRLTDHELPVATQQYVGLMEIDMQAQDKLIYQTEEQKATPQKINLKDKWYNKTIATIGKSKKDKKDKED